jgi:amino acid transporter
MARDGVFPFSHYLRLIFEPTKTPLANVLFVFVIDSILLLLQLVSTTAFAAIIAIATFGYQVSYLIPIFFRCTTARHTFPVGEFTLGQFSVPIAIISSIWLTITSIIMLFPANYPVTTDNMNYAVVVISGVAIIASLYWIFSARHWFVGPKRTDIDPTPLPPGHVTAEDVAAKESTMVTSHPSHDVVSEL